MDRTDRAGIRRRGGARPRALEASNAGKAYDRARDLPRLLPLWPHEISDVSAGGRLRIVRKLESALRAERRRGLSGHWSYDLARHAQLLAAWKLEVAATGPGDEAP